MSWAGMWLRVDSKKDKKPINFDNMNDRPILGNKEWTEYQIILDVPKESGTLNYGFLLNGGGKIWFDNVKINVVEESTKIYKENSIQKKPSNLNFSE